MFHEVAGQERSHLHGRNSEYRRMFTAEHGNRVALSDIRDRVESLASIRNGGDNAGKILKHFRD